MLQRLIAVLMVLILAAPSLGQVISRPIKLPRSARKADVVLVSFYSGGNITANGSGLAVVNAQDQPVGRRILANDPAGQTWLAIDLSGSRSGLKLQYSPKPLRTVKDDDKLPASLILQTYELKGRPSSKADQVLRALAGKHPLGTTMVSNISIAHNPFGASTFFVTVIQGQIHDAKGRTLKIFSAHDDSAFVELDGKWIINASKRRKNYSSEHLASKAGNWNLGKGIRTVRYLHVQRRGSSLALLGYMAGNRAMPLPSSLFVHHPKAELGQASASKDAPAVGFDAQQLDQLGYGKNIYSRWRLTPIAAAPKGLRYQWNFGDGVTFQQPNSDAAGASARALEHVFVGRIDRLGHWKVKLELVTGEEKLRVLGSAQSLLRAESFSNVTSTRNTGLVRTYGAAINGMDYRNAPALLMTRLFNLLATTEDPTLTAPLVEAFVEGAGRKPDSGGWRMRHALAGHLARDEPQRAADLYLQLARSGNNSWRRTCAAAQYFDLEIFRLGNSDKVDTLVYSMMRGRKPRERALLLSRLGDVHRMAGDIDAAAKAYEKAQQLSYRQMNVRKAAILDRAYRERALNLLNQARYPALRDMLFQWEADFPISKLGSDLPLLIGRYYQAIGDDPRAAIEFDTLLKLNPMHPSRPEFIFRLGQSLARQGKQDEAGKWFDDLAKKYPNSPFAADAAAWKP